MRNHDMNTQIAHATMTLLAAGLAVAAQAETVADGQWRGAGGAAAAYTSGNSSSSTLALNIEMARATAADKIILGGNVNYGTSKVAGVSTTNTDKWNGFGQYDWNLGPQLFAFGKLGLEGDKVAKLDLRTTLAGGLGYKVVDSKELAFTVFGGAGYSTDKYSVAQTIGTRTDTNFSRTSLYLGEESAHQLTPSTSFKQRLELYPGMSGDKAMMAKFSAGLAVSMTGTMSLNVGLTDAYNSKPPQGLKKNDLGVFTGINIKLGA
jgi:putative salt-induced outer membrane protein